MDSEVITTTLRPSRTDEYETSPVHSDRPGIVEVGRRIPFVPGDGDVYQEGFHKRTAGPDLGIGKSSREYLGTTDADRAFDQIKERIVSLRMPPGSMVPEKFLMDDLDLGRTPIREALRRLHALGLVVIIPRQGTFVSEVSVTDPQRIFEIRIELESLAARLASQRISQHKKDELRNLLAEYALLAAEDKQMFRILDEKFHRLVSLSAGNAFLQDELDLLYAFSLRLWNMVFDRFQARDMSVAAYYDVADALEQGDANRAAEAMSRKVREQYRAVMAKF